MKNSSNLINKLSGGFRGRPSAAPSKAQTVFNFIQFFFLKIRQNLMLAPPSPKGWRRLLFGIPDPPLMLQSKNVAVVVSVTSGVKSMVCSSNFNLRLGIYWQMFPIIT